MYKSRNPLCVSSQFLDSHSPTSIKASEMKAFLKVCFLVSLCLLQSQLGTGKNVFALHTPAELRRQIYEFMQITFPNDPVPVHEDSQLETSFFHLFDKKLKNDNLCFEQAGIFVSPDLMIPVHEIRNCTSAGSTLTHVQRISSSAAPVCQTAIAPVAVSRAVERGQVVRMKTEIKPLQAGCALYSS